MDKLVQELLALLRDMLAGQQQLLRLGHARREAMRAFDIAGLDLLTAREQVEVQKLAAMDRRRVALVQQFRAFLPRGTEPTVSEISKKVLEPVKGQLLVLAAQIRDTAESVSRTARINASVSEGVIKGLARVLKVVTGFAQHAGLYMRNGRKAVPHGIHLLEVTA